MEAQAGAMEAGVTVVVPTGALGVGGIRTEHVERGIAAGGVAIAVDAGSTDSGPSYLARGVSKYPRDAVKRDLEVLMTVRERAGVPLLVGSCGTSGCDAAVDWTLEIALEVAREQGLSPRIAVLYSEQDPGVLKAKLRAGRVRALPPAEALTEEALDQCDRVVALMGPEPFMAALEAGADIVLGGRTTDTAVMAAVPLMRGAGAGPAWHAGKTAECGGVCTTGRGDGGVMFTVFADRFAIEPLSAANRCTPETVSAHMLYENGDPFRLAEPPGVLDVTEAVYTATDERRVVVTGSRFEPRPYTMKLEGAGSGPFQTVSLIGIEDPAVLANLDTFHDRLQAALVNRIERTFGADAGAFGVSLRIYGWNAVSGRPVPAGAAVPREVGVLLVITAETQDLATRMAKACNPLFFHFPLSPDLPMPSYGFAFSPAEIESGQVYRFHLNHVVEATDGLELVRTRWVEAGAACTTEGAADAHAA